MYAMVCTRPDIAHAVGVVSRFLSNPGKEHWEAVKWILRYLKGTSKMCLCYGGAKLILESYAEIQEGTLAIEDADLSTLRDRYIVTANNKNIEILAGQISDIEGVNEVTAMVIPPV